MWELVIASMVTELFDRRPGITGHRQFKALFDDVLRRRVGGESELVRSDVNVVVGEEIEVRYELLGLELWKISGGGR